MPNSVDTLEPNDRFVLAVDKLSIARGIPYHSIIGDRGRGNTPNSSDGIVPYWSSHLAGAQSELIVASGHDAQTNPEAINETDRILKVNLAHRDNHFGFSGACSADVDPSPARCGPRGSYRSADHGGRPTRQHKSPSESGL